MFEILKNMLTARNEFASGGLLLMIVGGLSVYLRAAPERLWRWLVGQTRIIITVKDDDAAFVWVKSGFWSRVFSNEFAAWIWIRHCATSASR